MLVKSRNLWILCGHLLRPSLTTGKPSTLLEPVLVDAPFPLDFPSFCTQTRLSLLNISPTFNWISQPTLKSPTTRTRPAYLLPFWRPTRRSTACPIGIPTVETIWWSQPRKLSTFETSKGRWSSRKAFCKKLYRIATGSGTNDAVLINNFT